MITHLAAMAALTLAAPTDTPIEPIEESVVTFYGGDELCRLAGVAYPPLVVAIGDADIAQDMFIAWTMSTFEEGWNEDNAPGEPTGRMTFEAQEAWSDFLGDCMTSRDAAAAA